MGRRKEKDKEPCQHEQDKLAWEEQPKGQYHFGKCQCGQEVYSVVEQPKATDKEPFMWPE